MRLRHQKAVDQTNTLDPGCVGGSWRRVERRGRDRDGFQLGGSTMVKRGVLPADYSRIHHCYLVLTYTAHSIPSEH